MNENQPAGETRRSLREQRSGGLPLYGTLAPAPPFSPMRRADIAKRVIAIILTVSFVALVGMFVLKAFVFRTYFVPSDSMSPTLKVADTILIDLVSPHKDGYERGDIVVFRAPPSWPVGHEYEEQTALQRWGIAPEDDLVKRVIAGPGDKVTGFADGEVSVNGKALSEPYVRATRQVPFSITVPKGEYYLLGDNRADSGDSRFFGAVGEEYLIGKLLFVLP